MTPKEFSDALGGTAGLAVFVMILLIGLVYTDVVTGEKLRRACIIGAVVLFALVVMLALTAIWAKALL